MGNVEFIDRYERVRRATFDSNAFIEKYKDVLHVPNVNENYLSEQLQDKCFNTTLSTEQLYSLFPSGCRVDDRELREQDWNLAQERLKEDVLKDICIGYTTSESKLSKLKHSELERFDFRN